jgi:hypothetical protein
MRDILAGYGRIGVDDYLVTLTTPGPALARRKSATGSLYDATRSQARHSATMACSSSAGAGVGPRLRKGTEFALGVHDLLDEIAMSAHAPFRACVPSASNPLPSRDSGELSVPKRRPVRGLEDRREHMTAMPSAPTATEPLRYDPRCALSARARDRPRDPGAKAGRGVWADGRHHLGRGLGLLNGFR